MNRLRLAFAFLMLAPSAHAKDARDDFVPNSYWVNLRGSFMYMREFESRRQGWDGSYRSNEATSPQQCRYWNLRWLDGLNAHPTRLPNVTYYLPDGSLLYSLDVPNGGRGFDYVIHSRAFDTSGECTEETVWAATLEANPPRLCTVWWKRLPSGQIIKGRDIFWYIPGGPIVWFDGPFPWPRDAAVNLRACRHLTMSLNPVIRPAPKNYPVWPPFPFPVGR